MSEIEFEPLLLDVNDIDKDERSQTFNNVLSIPQVNNDNVDLMDVEECQQEFIPLPIMLDEQPIPEINYNIYLKKTFSLNCNQYDPFVEIENKNKNLIEENKRLKQIIEDYKLEIGRLTKQRKKERAAISVYKLTCQITFNKLKSANELIKKLQM